MATAYRNAIPYIGYWDIYKNYYANKQEVNGVMIHTENYSGGTITSCEVMRGDETIDLVNPAGDGSVTLTVLPQIGDVMMLVGELLDFENIVFDNTNNPITTIWQPNGKVTNKNGLTQLNWICYATAVSTQVYNTGEQIDPLTVANQIQLYKFPLANIDKMREDILASLQEDEYFVIDEETYAPYGKPLKKLASGHMCSIFSQEGLALKTYQSDIFNNWLNSEWIDGSTGINAISAISVIDDKITVDKINMANKVYNLLNRIAVAGGPLS